MDDVLRQLAEIFDLEVEGLEESLLKDSLLKDFSMKFLTRRHVVNRRDWSMPKACPRAMLSRFGKIRRKRHRRKDRNSKSLKYTELY